MGSGMSTTDIESQLAKLKADLEAENNDLSKLTEQTAKYLKKLKDATLDIAITGVAGAGKSSLVNALRGIKDNEKGAAETGVTETTIKATPYSHPRLSNVTIWDLPGIGTLEFQAKNYLQMVDFKKYDFFIIVAAERFTEHEVFLAREIKKMNKKFYDVRTKIDQAINSEKRKQPFNEEETLEKIRKYCCDCLAKAGESDPRVFLISAWDLSKYDFSLLVDALENDLDEFKRYALITMLSNFSIGIHKTKTAMQNLIYKVALVSCVRGKDRFPLLTFACTMSTLEASVRDFSKVFGLDENSLSRLANQVGKPVSMLRSAIRKTVIADQIDAAFIYRRLLHVSPKDEGIKWLGRIIANRIPYIGENSSISIVSRMQQIFLADAQEDAERVWATAFEISKSQTL